MLNIYVGRKDGTETGGIYLYSFDGEKILDRGIKDVLPGFTHIAVSDDKSFVIASGVVDGRDILRSYKINTDNSLSVIDEITLKTKNDVCHLDISSDNMFAVATDFFDGAVHIVDMNDTHHFGNYYKRIAFEGSSTSYRQDRSHPHSCFFNPNADYMYASDLGANRVQIIRRENNDWNQVSYWYGHDGIGQRHVAFSKDSSIIYSLAEITGHIAILKQEDDGGITELSCSQYMSHMPDYTNAEHDPIYGLPENYLSAADIVLSSDEKYLVSSYRGIFETVVMELEKLTEVKNLFHIRTKGYTRSIYLSNDRKYLVALGEESSKATGILEIFELDLENMRADKKAEKLLPNAFIQVTVEY